MPTDSENVLAALRAWSAPDPRANRRAELVAAAWRAGETRVAVLAEAARTTRPTIYADLRSQGIDPERRPPKEHPMRPVAIDDLTGLDEEADEMAIHFAQNRASLTHSPAEVDALTAEMNKLRYALTVYNTTRPLLAAEERAREDRDRRLHLVELRWEALSTATAWHAAHHAYVVAVDAARTAITAWADAARPVAGPTGDLWYRSPDLEQVYRERIVEAGHPPISFLGIDVDAEAARLREELDQAHEHRRALAAQTLNIAPPTAASH